ncbi:MAG: SH3 domain-containing protein [Saccharofermentans sp.]|nr:SH3 domain-containing protein [Saccharofermentans sp.]
MKSFGYRKIAALALTGSMLLSLSACGKTEETTTSSTTTQVTIATITTPSTTQTTIPVYEGPLETADTTETSWTETPLQNGSLTLYSTVSAGNFLRVRKGPSVDYDIVGTLTRGQSVVVVASTANDWYKTEDGYYISGQYLKTTMPQ